MGDEQAHGTAMLASQQLNAKLRVAAGLSELAIVRECLALGADVHDVDDCGDAAIHAAARAGSVEICSILISAGTRLDVGNSKGLTPLVLAAQSSNAAFCKRLIDAGVDVNAQSAFGASIVHFASTSRDPGPLRLLLSAGARVDGLDEYQRSPLHYAAMFDCVEEARILVGAGLSPSYEPVVDGERGLTPFQLAVRSGAKRVAHYFIAECGESMNQICADGRTMVELAMRHDLIDFLLAVQVEVDVAAAVGSESGERSMGRNSKMEPI